MTMRTLKTVLLLTLILGVSVSSTLYAQQLDQAEKADIVDPASVRLVDASAEKDAKPEAKKPLFNPAEYQSLVFTDWEEALIEDARRARDSGEAVRAPTDAEITRDLATREDGLEKVKPPPEEREIRLGGIVFHGADDWTIWMNEQRITPDALPKEVLGMKVYKTYIEMKWFDEYSNQIFPIRLRPHQRFNIDTRIFLPG